MAETQSSIYSHIPNGITIVRLILAIAFPFLPEGWHFTVIAIALASEFLDGFIARLCGWTSYLGQVLDPIADKFFFFFRRRHLDVDGQANVPAMASTRGT